MKQRSLFDELREIVKRPVQPVPAVASGVTLRPYQRDAVSAVFSEWDSGSASTLVVMPTGTGKSVVFSEVMRRYRETAA